MVREKYTIRKRVRRGVFLRQENKCILEETGVKVCGKLERIERNMKGLAI